MSDQTYPRAYPLTLDEVIERIRERETNDQNDQQEYKHQPRSLRRDGRYAYDDAA